MRNLTMRLGLLQVGACTCLTKTPAIEHHDEQCRYRVLHEAQQEIGRLNQRIAELESARTADRPPVSHDLYTDQDKDRPDAICDRNGQVALSLCKKCGRGESELAEPCDMPPNLPADLTADEIHSGAHAYASEIWVSPMDGMHFDFQPQGLADFVRWARQYRQQDSALPPLNSISRR